MAVACTSESPDPPPAPGPIGGTLAFATTRDVRVVRPDGTIQTVAQEQRDVDACAWSGDGRHFAWTGTGADGTATLHVHDVAAGRTGTWADTRLASAGIAGTVTGFVAVHRATGKPPELVVADAADVVAGRAAKAVRLPLRAGTLLTAEGTRALVAQPVRGAAFTGGPATVYEVTFDGRVRPLFTDRRDWTIKHAAFAADGARLVHSAGRRDRGPDRVSEFVVVRDLVAKTEREVAPPSRAGADSTTPLSVVTGGDGRTVVAFAFRGPNGEDLGHAAYALDGETWSEVADGAAWAATGPTGKVATVGPNAAGERLTVEGRVLADGVQCAAWAP